ENETILASSGGGVRLDADARSRGNAEAKERDAADGIVRGSKVGRAAREEGGMQFAVLSGDPKIGPYTQIRKVAAGPDNPLHSHGSEIKNVIIRGVWYTGADAASAKDFGPGSVIVMPADWVHVSGCRAGNDCVFYQEGKGKFDFKPAGAHSRHSAWPSRKLPRSDLPRE